MKLDRRNFLKNAGAVSLAGLGASLAHVADVKEANGVAHGMVLGEHARRVLDRHLPATEWNHSATQGNMRIKERRASERFAPWVLRHGSLSFEALTASCHMIRR